MERARLVELLDRRSNLKANAGPTVVTATDAARFMADFSAAVAAGGDVFLADPAWGEAERRELAELLRRPPEPRAGDRGWLMVPTGGTSGGLRFARHDLGTVGAAVEGFRAHFGVNKVNAVGVLPLHHVSGLLAWLRGVLSGGEYRGLAWREVEAGPWPELPARPDGWFCSLVPTQLERLLRLPGAVAWLRGFRGVFIGGGPSWPALLERAAEARLPLLLSYGMTETAAMVAAQRPGDFAAGDRSCGTALPHARLEIGADGAVVIRADSLWRGYYPGWREPGPLVTPDFGALDAAGRLTLRGRGDGVVISGGEKIQPEEVEAALRATGQFADVAVVGVADAEWGSRLVALYPRGAPPDMAVVAETLSGQLARHKHPKAFVAVADWPRNAQGKLNRARLAELAQGRA